MNLRDMLRIELIGLKIEITKAKNKSLVGLKGRIIGETKNTFLIETKNKEKKVIKDQITFITKIDGKEVEIKGKILRKRPEDRLKL